MAVQGNHITAPDGDDPAWFGVVAQSATDSDHPIGCTVSDNRIEGFPFGISANRPGLQITDNRIRLASPTAAIGLLIMLGEDGRVTGNRIDFTGLDDSVSGIGVMNITSSRLRIEGNHMLASHAIVPVLSYTLNDFAPPDLCLLYTSPSPRDDR